MKVTHLYCSFCGIEYERCQIYNLCDRELLAAVKEIGAAEGIFVVPEGAACLPALKQLIERGEVSRDERVVLLSTGGGLKYLNAFDRHG